MARATVAKRKQEHGAGAIAEVHSLMLLRLRWVEVTSLRWSESTEHKQSAIPT